MAPWPWTPPLALSPHPKKKITAPSSTYLHRFHLLHNALHLRLRLQGDDVRCSHDDHAQQRGDDPTHPGDVRNPGQNSAQISAASATLLRHGLSVPAAPSLVAGTCSARSILAVSTESRGSLNTLKHDTVTQVGAQGTSVRAYLGPTLLFPLQKNFNDCVAGSCDLRAALCKQVQNDRQRVAGIHKSSFCKGRSESSSTGGYEHRLHGEVLFPQ